MIGENLDIWLMWGWRPISLLHIKFLIGVSIREFGDLYGVFYFDEAFGVRVYYMKKTYDVTILCSGKKLLKDFSMFPLITKITSHPSNQHEKVVIIF